jgi:hypothetical protein
MTCVRLMAVADGGDVSMINEREEERRRPSRRMCIAGGGGSEVELDG